MKYLILSLFIGLASQAKVACFSKDNIGPTPLTIESNGTGSEITIAFKNASCKLSKVSYDPTSPKYTGYWRYSPIADQCDKVSLLLLGTNSTTKKTVELHWISVSPEAMASKQGFVQVGYQNIYDPGAGGTAKMMLGCFPARY